jgi:probable rRNA maturation factor
LKISLINRKILREKLEIRKIEKVVRELARNEKKRLGEIEIILLDDQELLKINRNFLKHDYFTDVITFSYSKKDKIMGDIYISADTVRNNADKFKQDFLLELTRVIIHGMLHLAGYDDKSDKEKRLIKKREDFYLKRYNALKNE